MTPVPPVHPDLAPVELLLGTWSGSGHGEYPTIPPFGYVETVTLDHNGKPFIAYTQRTRSLADPPVPMHAETGYWRFPTGDRVELVLAHPTGVAELQAGTLDLHPDGTIVIELATTTVALTASAKEVTAIERTFRITGDTLTYEVRMAAVGQPLQHHLAATLHRA